MLRVSSLISIPLTCVVVLWASGQWNFLLFFVFLSAILLSISGTVTAHIMLSMKHAAKHFMVLSSFSNFHKYILWSCNNHIRKTGKRFPVLFGRSVDIALQDLLELIVRDLISPWLEDLALSSKELHYSIK